ncbi:MAG: phosphoribosylformylglycinamidine synthase subunit PurS [Candidatus Diapherotrites archaeon]
MQRIEVAFKDNNLDSIGLSTKNSIEEDLGIKEIETTHFSEIYYFDVQEKLNLKEIAEKVFIDPITQTFSINEEIFPKYDFYLEVKLHPDVTDNVGIVALEGVNDYLGKELNGKIITAKKFYFEGKASTEQVERIAKELLANEVIETYEIGGNNE